MRLKTISLGLALRRSATFCCHSYGLTISVSRFQEEAFPPTMMPASYLHGPLAPSTPSPKKRKRPSNTQVIDLTSPSPTSTPSKSTPRRPRKPKNADDTPSPEKRIKRYRDHAPQSVMVKHERVMTQRMFLVERSGRQNGALQEDFSVLGSTGNVYTVKVSMVPT